MVTKMRRRNRISSHKYSYFCSRSFDPLSSSTIAMKSASLSAASTHPSSGRPQGSRTKAHPSRQAVVVRAGPWDADRRSLLLGMGTLVASVSVATPAPAAEETKNMFSKQLKKKKLKPEDYMDGPEGLKIYELVEGGKGDPIKKGDKVIVHYDCIFRGINAVSSRNARTLGGNRTIAEPFSFTVGERIVSFGKSAGDTAGGLFVGGGGPKAPQALSNAAIGMRVGGKRSILVTPELGFGAKGELEIPPNATFELQVEVLGVTA